MKHSLRLIVEIVDREIPDEKLVDAKLVKFDIIRTTRTVLDKVVELETASERDICCRDVLRNAVDWDCILKEANIQITEDNEPLLYAHLWSIDKKSYYGEFEEFFEYRYPAAIYNAAVNMKKSAEKMSAVEMMDKLTIEYGYSRINSHKIIKSLYIVDNEYVEKGIKVKLIPHLPPTRDLMWLLNDIDNRDLYVLTTAKELRE